MNRGLLFILVAAAGGAIAIVAMAQPAPAEKADGGPAAQSPKGARGPDRFFETNDVNADGKVTIEELVASAKKLMKDLDANEDGAITRDELHATKKARVGQQGEGDGERMRPEDRRGPPEDGRGQGRRGGGDGEGRGRPSPEDIFERLDTNGDGSVSLEEFKAGQPERGPRGGRR